MCNFHSVIVLKKFILVQKSCMAAPRSLGGVWGGGWSIHDININILYIKFENIPLSRLGCTRVHSQTYVRTSYVHTDGHHKKNTFYGFLHTGVMHICKNIMVQFLVRKQYLPYISYIAVGKKTIHNEPYQWPITNKLIVLKDPTKSLFFISGSFWQIKQFLFNKIAIYNLPI